MLCLRLVTFNTWNCQGDFERRVPLMVDGLRAVNGDVVLLQEVFSEAPSGFDLAQHVARALGLRVLTAPARKKKRTRDGSPTLCHSGLAVLAKAQLSPLSTVRLPEDIRDGERLGQIVRVEHQGLDMAVANVHLSHLQDGDELRRRQLQTLLDHAPKTSDLMVVGGDLNMNAAHPALTALREEGGFAPATFANDETPSTTLNAIDGTEPSGGMIDHLFFKSRAGVSLETHARVDLNTPDHEHGLYPSDHMAVVADVIF